MSCYNAILADGNPMNWALFGYFKGTAALSVIESGSNGIDQLLELFEDSKIQYALLRAIDPNSQLPKLVFISWCGEGVPVSKKGFFNSHVSQIASFFKVL